MNSNLRLYVLLSLNLKQLHIQSAPSLTYLGLPNEMQCHHGSEEAARRFKVESCSSATPKDSYRNSKHIKKYINICAKE